ncbi:hypothetical protein [Bacillus wiedmannii]|uniref:hypothetical protein n=1 Tax=Bacillus wiedmannii TaxID=1890302 RepID=UPI000BF121DB|nr:hypothetical protein [Bacillus wiedmannii]PEO36741.1 hypothetical protein CN555_21300 [Bacillus wiedmannii]
MRYIAGIYSVAIFLLMSISIMIGSATMDLEMTSDMWSIFVVFIVGIIINVISVIADGRDWH